MAAPFFCVTRNASRSEGESIAKAQASRLTHDRVSRAFSDHRIFLRIALAGPASFQCLYSF